MVDMKFDPPPEVQSSKDLHQSNILPKTIKQRHVEGMLIFRGLAADRPTNTPVTEVLAYWATDTGVLSIWNGTTWLSETLT